MKTSKLEFLFEQILIANKIKYQKEYKFHETRKWRFDFLIDDDLAVEIEGSVWAGGRHTRGSGFTKDVEKYNTATTMGFKILRYYNGNMNNFLNDYKELKKNAKKR